MATQIINKKYTNGEVKEAKRIGIEVEDLAEWNAHEESEEGQNKKAELTLSSFEQAKTNLIILASDTIHKFLWARLEGFSEESVKAYKLHGFSKDYDFDLRSDFRNVLQKNLKEWLRDQKTWGED